MTIQDQTLNDKKNLVLFHGQYPNYFQQQLYFSAHRLGLKILPVKIDAYKSHERYSNLYPNQAARFEENKAEIAGAHVQLVMQMDNDDPSAFFFDTINTLASIKKCNPASIDMILPYIPFARQDHERDHAGNFMSNMAETYPRLLKFSGADSVTTMDMHSRASEGYFKEQFSEPHTFHNISSVSLLHDFILQQYDDTLFHVGGADGGNKPEDLAQRRARKMAKRIANNNNITNPDGIIFKISKEHIDADNVMNTNYEGHVAGQETLLVDDMIDGGGTMFEAADTLKENDAKTVIALATHGIFSGNSVAKLTSSTIPVKKDGIETVIPNPIDHVIVTDSILSVYQKAKELTAEQQERLDIVTVIPVINNVLKFNFIARNGQKNLDLNVTPA